VTAIRAEQYQILARLGQLQDRIDTALAIHAPCHMASAGPYSGCLCGQWKAGLSAVCVVCTVDGSPVSWPCPTARALGAVTP
jgi:hypothetical protein